VQVSRSRSIRTFLPSVHELSTTSTLEASTDGAIKTLKWQTCETPPSTHTHTRARAHARMRTHTHTHTHTRTHTHTQTGTRSISVAPLARTRRTCSCTLSTTRDGPHGVPSPGFSKRLTLEMASMQRVSGSVSQHSHIHSDTTVIIARARTRIYHLACRQTYTIHGDTNQQGHAAILLIPPFPRPSTMKASSLSCAVLV
jgi:hypothetical protein